MLENLNLDHYSVGIPAIIILIILILILQSLVKKHLGKQTIAECHEVGSYYLSMVGTFYAVLLGLIVVDAMTKFQSAEDSVDRETTALLKIYSSAERFPQYQNKIDDLIINYTNEVINVEFPLMEKSGKADLKALAIALELLSTVKQIEPVSENQKAIFPIMINDVSDLVLTRRERTKPSNFGEPPIEWIILIIGGVICIILTFFFTIESSKIHMLMRGAVSLTILMSLYLTYLFGAPFSGDLKISKEPFMNVLKFAEWSNNHASVATPQDIVDKMTQIPATTAVMEETHHQKKRNPHTKH